MVVAIGLWYAPAVKKIILFLITLYEFVYVIVEDFL